MTQFGPQWTTPPAPDDGRLKARRVWGGIGIAMGGHILTILVSIGLATVDSTGWWLGVGLLAQVALFVACLTVGIVLMSRRERGIGLGLVIGWAVGFIVLPVIGFGICLYVFSQMNSA